MGRTKDHNRATAKPYLIATDEAGQYRLILCETRYNSQNYPLVRETLLDESFPSAAAVRAHAKAEFGAVAGEFAVRPARGK